MRFGEEDLRAAVAGGVLEAERFGPLVAFLNARKPAALAAPSVPAPKFDLAHLLWYAGALIVITAMGLFSTLAFSAMGGKALTATAVAYAAVFAVAGHHLWHQRGLPLPGGLLVAIAVSMAPLAVYGLQDASGVWSHGSPGAYRDFYVWIKGSWVFMEVAAILAAVLALRFYPFPFIVMIIAFSLWFLSMDLTPWVFGKAEFSWDERRAVSLWFGLAVLVVAWLVDRRQRGGDFAFWLHLFGMLAFWGALSMSDSSSEFGKLLYALLNGGLLMIAIFMGRRVYAVFGTIGIAFYLGHLADKVFKDSLLFPFALSLIGVAVIALGLLYHRNQATIAAWMEESLPQALKDLRPPHARQ
jgi:hypothetical protein